MVQFPDALERGIAELKVQELSVLSPGELGESIAAVSRAIDDLESERLRRIANGLSLCNRHHHFVHEGGWKIEMHPDGSVTATPPPRARAPAAAA